MSTCLILTQGNKIYIGADTACSVKTSHGYKRISNDMQKLFSIGNNIFFCSGKKTSVDTCVKWIYSNFENNIDISRLKEYLKYNFSFQNEEKIFDIEFLLCDYDNCQISQLSQYNNFEPIIYEFSNQVRIICGGYKTKDSFMIAQNNILSRNSIYEIYKNVFENISDECVGGKIVLYSSPTNKSIFEIRENNIEYARIEELFLLTSDFVTAGFVYGSQIINGDIYSEDYRESDGVGSHIGLKGTGRFQFGRKLSFDGENLILKDGQIQGGSLLIGDKSGTYAEITEDGVLNCNGANIYGNINAIGGSFSGDIESTATISGGTINGAKVITDNPNTLYSTVISDGCIYTYGSKNGSSIKTGKIQSFRSGGETSDNFDGFALVLGDSADAITFGIDISNDTKFNSYYYLNNGLNPNGYSERHVFFGYERHLGKIYTDTIENSIGYGVISSKYLGLSSSGNLYDQSKSYRFYCNGNSVVEGISIVYGDFVVENGTKSRLATTENYNDRLLYCYETPSPMFGDIGEGKIDETGKCYIFLDDVFAETIDTDCIYQVFLQSYGQGECYVTERTSSYFIVEGTINLSFGWEVKAIQKDFDTMRLEEYQEIETIQDYAEETYNYLIESLEE